METPNVAQVLRALTPDRQIRMAALNASPLWDGVRRGHPHLEAQACACLTELLAATLLIQSRGDFAERIQVLVRTAGRAKAVVSDAWPDGMIRGVLDLAPEVHEGPWIAAPGLMQVMRSGRSGEPAVAKLEMVEGPLATQLEYYLQQSEQVDASLSLWCDPATGEAGGLLVEPLPACPPERLARVLQALDGLEVVPHWERTPDFLFDWVNQGPGAERLSVTDIAYRCRCTREGLVQTLTGLGQNRIDELFPEGAPAEIRCDYCGQVFLISPDEVGGHGA